MTNCAVCDARTDTHLCQRHTRQLEDTLGELPALLHELDVTISRQDRGTGAPLYAVARRYVQTPGIDYTEGETTLPSTPWPFAWDAANTRWTAEHTIVTWALHVCRRLGLNTRRLKQPGQLLLAQLDDIRTDPEAGAMFDEITAAHRDVTRAIDRQAPDVFAGRCTAEVVTAAAIDDVLLPTVGPCGTDLLAHTGDDEVRCGTCGATYDLTARRRSMVVEVDDEWARPQVIADALTSLDEPVKASTLRTWIERDAKLAERLHGRPAPHPLILQRGIDDDGRALYRVGDVRARIAWARGRMTA